MFAVAFPLGVAIVGALVAVVLRRYLAGAWWPSARVLALFGFGGLSATFLRLAERAVMAQAMAPTNVSEQRLYAALRTFGVTGPVTVLVVASVVWVAASRRHVAGDREPALFAPVVAAGLATVHLLTETWWPTRPPLSGLHAGLLVFDELVLAAMLGLGIARSALDGTLGGTPFGRFAFATIVLRSLVELGLEGGFGFTGVAVSWVTLLLVLPLVLFGVAGVYRPDVVPLDQLRKQSLQEFARKELQRGRIRPLWVALGALSTVGTLVLGLLGAALVGAAAHVDFGEMDRGGAGTEYAALLIGLGVLVAFPGSALVVSVASGGRRQAGQVAHVLEAGLSALLALFGLLVVLGVVAPVAATLGIAFAPVAFALAALGAWIAAGRKH